MGIDDAAILPYHQATFSVRGPIVYRLSGGAGPGFAGGHGLLQEYVLRLYTPKYCLGRWYIGMSADIQNRLAEHNAGRVRSTKGYKPWRIIYTEQFASKTDARKREIQIKRSGIIRKLLKEKINKAPSSIG